MKTASFRNIAGSGGHYFMRTYMPAEYPDRFST